MPRSESDSLIPILIFQVWNSRIRIRFLDSDLGISGLKFKERNRILSLWFRFGHFNFQMQGPEADCVIPILAFQIWNTRIGIRFLDPDPGISGLECKDRNQIPWGPPKAEGTWSGEGKFPALGGLLKQTQQAKDRTLYNKTEILRNASIQDLQQKA